MMKKPLLEIENSIMTKSVYIHIPFCKKICSYCDFCKMFYNEKLVDKYLIALEKEIDLNYKNEPLNTIYIGGGTPSSLKLNELEKLFSIIKKFKLEQGYEFTFECNIDDIEKELLIFLKNNGVNRLSIGVQSFNKKILNTIGRSSISNIKEKINLAKEYFNNINVDLIFGVYNQSLKELQKDLNKYIDLDINHISIYSLILEDNTILKINNYHEIEDEQSRKMYDYICKYLKGKGYNHYEISNFEKNNTYSRHNMVYWNNDKYYGFGLGASGYIRNIRYTNTRSLTNYLNGKYMLEKERITKRTDMENFMILGLRKIKGVTNTEFKKRYHNNIEDIFNTSKLQKENNNYFIKESNLYISNYILKDFID